MPAGLLGVRALLRGAFGDPLKFVHVQAFWGREPSLPWDGIVNASSRSRDAVVDGAIFQPIVVLNVIDLLAVLVTLVLLVLSVVGPWRLGPESLYLIVFAAVGFLVVLISPIGLDYRRCTACPGTCWRSCRRSSCWPGWARTGTSSASTCCPRWPSRACSCSRFYYDIWLS